MFEIFFQFAVFQITANYYNYFFLELINMMVPKKDR